MTRGRPKLPPDLRASEHVATHVTPAEWAALESWRGDVPRSEAIRFAIRRAMRRPISRRNGK